MKYIILSDSDNVEPFTLPRQLIEINGEPLIKRTIRLLKENGIEDIIITSHDKRFDNLGAVRYEPKFNNYKPRENKGYWVEAFPIELLDDNITFLLGDVYYSEKAIKTIVESKTNFILYFCSYHNKDTRYIKHHDEPFAFKVVDVTIFKEHIERMKSYKDSGNAKREPIAWELYRSINGYPITTHIVNKNCIVINDETCDVDRVEDVDLLNIALSDSIVHVKANKRFTLANFDKIYNLVRENISYDIIGTIYEGDEFDCDTRMANYLSGENKYNKSVIDILKVTPSEKDL